MRIPAFPLVIAALAVLVMTVSVTRSAATSDATPQISAVYQP